MNLCGSCMARSVEMSVRILYYGTYFDIVYIIGFEDWVDEPFVNVIE